MRSLYRRYALKLLLSDEYRSRRLRQCYLEWYGVEVGLYSYGCFDSSRFRSGIKIGRYCSFAPTAAVFTRNHPFGLASMHPFTYDPSLGFVDKGLLPRGNCVIEDDVWMGHGVIVTPGVRLIGRGSVIGAGSVVTKDVARYSVVVGNPAVVRRMRFSADVIDALEKSHWWELDIQDLKAVAPEFPFTPLAKSFEWLLRIQSAGK